MKMAWWDGGDEAGGGICAQTVDCRGCGNHGGDDAGTEICAQTLQF